jgi:hypothetical protein
MTSNSSVSKASASRSVDLNVKYAVVVSLDETLQYLKTVGHNQPAS